MIDNKPKSFSSKNILNLIQIQWWSGQVNSHYILAYKIISFLQNGGNRVSTREKRNFHRTKRITYVSSYPLL